MGESDVDLVGASTTATSFIVGEDGSVWMLRDGRACAVAAYRDREAAKQQAGL